MKSTFCMLVAALVATLGAFAGEKLVKSGETVVFLGDSITHYGSGQESGYVRMTVSGLKANGIDVTWFGAGVPGNKALHMRKRLEKDVLSHKPTLVTLSAGVNDVWFLRPDSALDKYRVDMEEMVKSVLASGSRMVLLTPTTVMGETSTGLIADYAQAVRELAAKYKLPVADMHAAIRAVLTDKSSPWLFKGRKATRDGVHMAPMGDRAMARCLLRTFGLDDAEMAKAEAAWNANPEICKVNAKVGVPLATYRKLEAEADAAGCSIEETYAKAFRKGVDAVLKDGQLPAPAAAKAKPASADETKPCLAIFGDYFQFVEDSSRSGLKRLLAEADAATGKGLNVVTTSSTGSAVEGCVSKLEELQTKRKVGTALVSVGGYNLSGKSLAAQAAAVSNLVAKTAAAGTRIVFVTTRPVRQHLTDNLNALLLSLADGKRVFTVDRHALIVGEMKRRAANKQAKCTAAGYPLNANVNFLTAQAMLPALGFTDAEFDQVVARWNAMDDFADVDATLKVSFAEWDALAALAAKSGRPLDEVLVSVLERATNALR